MDKRIEVSVVCLAYNHGKYIRQTLEGFVSQTTSFRYEVIVHDDASLDDTAEVIREYAAKYPEIFVPIYQSENQYSQHISIIKDYVAPLIKGKYVALCEGDDYWISPNKLQIQYDIMESHPQAAMSVHKVRGVTEAGEDTERFYPNKPEFATGEIPVQDLLDCFYTYPFQTSSYFMRADLYKELNTNPPEFKKQSGVGDEPMMLFMSANGRMYYYSECLSCYRQMSGSSWSRAMSSDFSKRQKNAEKRYNMMKEFDAYTNRKYDCHLTFYEGRYLLYSENYSELLKNRKGEYYQSLSAKKRVAIWTGAMLPFMRKYIRNKI